MPYQTPRDDVPRLLMQLLRNPRQLSEFLRYGAGAKPGSPNYGRGWYFTGAPTPPGKYAPQQTSGFNFDPDRQMQGGRTAGAAGKTEVLQSLERGGPTKVLQEGESGVGSKIVRAARAPGIERRVRTTLPRELPPQMEAVPNQARLTPGLTRGAPMATALIGAPILDYLMRLASQKSLVDQMQRRYGARKESA